jgi:hypothetical protein
MELSLYARRMAWFIHLNVTFLLLGVLGMAAHAQMPRPDEFNPGANSEIIPLIIQPDGKIVVGGDFTTLGGQARSRIGRLNPDGSLDNGFNPGASGYVFAIAMREAGDLVVAGRFTALGG